MKSNSKRGQGLSRIVAPAEEEKEFSILTVQNQMMWSLMNCI